MRKAGTIFRVFPHTHFSEWLREAAKKVLYLVARPLRKELFFAASLNFLREILSKSKEIDITQYPLIIFFDFLKDLSVTFANLQNK